MAALSARATLGLLLLGIGLMALLVDAQPGLTYMPNTGFVEPPPSEPGPSYMQRRLIRRPLVLPRQGPLCYVERIEARDAAEGVLVAGGTAGDGGAKISAKETAFLETRSSKADSQRGNPAPSASSSPHSSLAETEAHSSLSMRASALMRRRQQQSRSSAQVNAFTRAHTHAEGEGGDVGSAPGMIQHVCKYSGVDDVTDGDGKTRGVLRYPENIEFKRVASHYFSCCDPRSKYAVLGTLGGDIGEFINALAVMEKLQKRPYNEAEVNTLFQQFLKIMAKRGRLYFYMHTDEEAMKALADAAQAKDPRRPASPQERNRLLKAAIQPDNVGCQHLKGLLSEPDGYGVRKQITEWVMQAYLSIYYDDANPLRTLLLYTVSPGKLEKAKGTARIWSPDECPGIAPLIVPNTGTTQAAVVHQAHAAYFRQDLARFLSFQNAFIEVKAIYNELQNLAAKQVAEKMSAYADGKTVEVIFSSAWDRWPF